MNTGIVDTLVVHQECDVEGMTDTIRGSERKAIKFRQCSYLENMQSRMVWGERIRERDYCMLMNLGTILATIGAPNQRMSQVHSQR